VPKKRAQLRKGEKMVTEYQNRNSRNKKKLWGAIAIGIICIVIVILFLSGIGSALFRNDSGTPAGSSVAAQAAVQTAQTPQASSQVSRVNPGVTINASDIPYVVPTPVPVPGSGVYVRVGYLGQYTGSYTANGVSYEVKNSGFHIYTIDQPTGTIMATFEKADDGVKHNLTAEIWENGGMLAQNLTYDPFGTVSVSANV
jgi:hypothetical protein